MIKTSTAKLTMIENKNKLGKGRANFSDTLIKIN